MQYPPARKRAVPDSALSAALEGRMLLVAAMASARAGEPPRDMPTGALLRMKSLMAGEGLPCDLARLCDDRHYAYERIAAAHATANEPLRRLALELFQIYHRRADASGRR